MAVMTSEERWAHLANLDEELLKGGVALSEWCTFIVCEADTAFANGADLASILTAVAAIEAYLRSEYAKTTQDRLVDLINQSSLDDTLKGDVHALRKYRNKWVHVDDPWDDRVLLERPNETSEEVERMALQAARVLRRVIYENQFV